LNVDATRRLGRRKIARRQQATAFERFKRKFGRLLRSAPRASGNVPLDRLPESSE
jgi:hypothetical protein